MRDIIKRLLFIIMILLSVTLYTYDVIISHTPPSEHLMKTVFMVMFCLICIYRLKTNK